MSEEPGKQSGPPLPVQGAIAAHHLEYMCVLSSLVPPPLLENSVMGASRSEYQLLSPGSIDEEFKGIESEYLQRDYFARRIFFSRLSLKDVSVAVILLAQSIIILVLILTKGSQSPLQKCYNGNSSNDHLGQILYCESINCLEIMIDPMDLSTRPRSSRL